MSWTRSAAMRAGLAGAAGAALVLSTLPPLTATSSPAVPAAADEDGSAITLAGSDMTVTWPLDADRVEAVEAARYGQAASRAAERAHGSRPRRRSSCRGTGP